MNSPIASNFVDAVMPRFARCARIRPPRSRTCLRRRATHAGCVLAIAVGLAGCVNVKRLAVDKLGDALAGGGTTFASDDDPVLVRDATAFSLKLMESLLAESPRHRGLLLAAASGFTQYGYAFIQQEADELEDKDVAAAGVLRLRARRLYLRARDYGLRGLEVAHPGVGAALRREARQAVAGCTAADVPLLYWTAASWAAAIAVQKDNPELFADLPIMEAIMDRAAALDEAFDHGAIHSFLITYEMSRPGGEGSPAERAKRHFDRALELSRGQQAGPLVSYAEAVCVPKQDRARFEELLKQALAIDVDARREWRLVNLVMQRRARWLLERVSELFLAPPAAS